MFSPIVRRKVPLIARPPHFDCAPLQLAVDNLERRQRSARERLENLLAVAMPIASEPVNPDPLGSENGPHQYTYKPSLYPQEDTVVASKACKSTLGKAVPTPEGPEERQEPSERAGQGGEKPGRTDSGTVMRLSTDELMLLAPRLRTYLKTATPAWPDIVDAADWLRGELGVSKSLWGEACGTMGREQAAIAIAIVSAKPAEHFRSTPGGYFHGMVTKAKAGELNLSRTVWGLRQATAPKSRRTPGASGGQGTRAW